MLVTAALAIAACGGGGADLGAHHDPTEAFPVAFDHPSSWSYEETQPVSAFPPAYLSEAQDEAPQHGEGEELQGVMCFAGTRLHAQLIGEDDEVVADGSVTIGGEEATRTEVLLSDGGWHFHSLLFVIPRAGGDEVALLFLANENSFDAELFDAIAATAEIGAPATGG
jgi:hypothetical protein